MSIRNQNWYNLQSTRSYPLDESSTAVDDTGAFIRDDILVDCHIRFSSDLGQHLYLQGLTVSAGLITAVFGVAATLNSAGSTVASVTVVRPGNAYANYSIVPLVAGVSGWVVFGPGIDTPFVGRYTNPAQALINPRCGRTYRPLPVPSIGKINLATSLQDVVTITGIDPVIAEYKLVQYGDKEMRAIVFRLDDTQRTDTYNPLEQFLPTCAKRPESGTCYKQPITSINGIEPDCNGNIVIAPHESITLTPFDDCGGVDMTTPRSLAEACAALQPKRPTEYEDNCCVSTVIGDTTTNSPVITNAQNMDKIVLNLTVLGLAIPADAVVIGVNAVAQTITLSQSATATATGASLKFYKEEDASCWPDVTQIIDIIEDETEPVYPPRELPIIQNFNSCVLVPEFDTQAGSLAKTETLAPPPLGDTPAPGPTTLTSHFVLETTGYSTLNISTIKNGATDWAYGHTITTELKIGVNGVARNGGIVLNYVQRIVNNSRITTYIAVLIDVQRAQIVVRRYTNAAYITDTAVDFTSKPDTWYRLAVTPSFDGGDNISITFEVSEVVANDYILYGTATFLNCVTPVGASAPVCQPTDGAFGIIAAQSQTFFNSFTVT